MAESISKTLSDATVVVVAQTHNPTIATRDWLISKQVFPERDFEGYEDKFLHVPVVAQCETKSFHFKVDEHKLEIKCKQCDAEVLERLPQTIGAYVLALPETRYTGLGFNFIFDIGFASAQEREAYVRSRMLSPKFPLLSKEGEPEFDTGLMLQIRAGNRIVNIRLEPDWSQSARMKANLNFHYTVAGSDALIERLSEHEHCRISAFGYLETLFCSEASDAPMRDRQ